MSTWHYICKDTVMFKSDKDPRNGLWYCYLTDTFDYILNDHNWVCTNNAQDEYDWIADQLDRMLESNDGKFIFIPTPEVATKIDAYYAEKELEYS